MRSSQCSATSAKRHSTGATGLPQSCFACGTDQASAFLSVWSEPTPISSSPSATTSIGSTSPELSGPST